VYPKFANPHVLPRRLLLIRSIRKTKPCRLPFVVILGNSIFGKIPYSEFGPGHSSVIAMNDLYAVIAALLALLFVELSGSPGASADSQAYTPEQLIEAASGGKSFGGDSNPLTSDIASWWSGAIRGAAAATGQRAIAVAGPGITFGTAEGRGRTSGPVARKSSPRGATAPLVPIHQGKRDRLSDSETSMTLD
jgi:hypothetical protein